MMSKLKSLVFIAVMILFATGAVLVAPLPAQAKAQTTCPVLGGNIDKNVFVDYQGKRIYFCCQGCDAEFNKNPEKYLKKLEEQGVTPEPVPAAKGKTGK
jgi:YHS domain-containing protein